MNSEPTNEQDRALIEAARQTIAQRFRKGHHHLGAAIRTKTGRVFCSVHLEANVGRVAVCAEAVALGMAASEGDTDIETIVAVDRKGNVVSPCGMCRELLSDYADDCRVIVPNGQEEVVVRLSDLLPSKFVKRWVVEGETTTPPDSDLEPS